MTATEHAARRGLLALGAAVLLLLPALAACGGGTTSASGGDGTTPPPATSAPATPDEPSTSTSPDEVVPEVTSTVAGSAVGGNSGGTSEGQTDSASETVRSDDGSCTGWAGRAGGTWTRGLVDGAKITVKDGDSGAVIGSGRLGAGAARDVGTGDRAQWMCTFPFTATVRGPVPATLRLDIAGARPMTARPDPTAPGRFVASVSTDAAPRLVADCRGLPTGPATGIWDPVVGLYWNSGLQQVCSQGVAVTVARVCRPAAIGSDAVVAVVKADDPGVVYEDASRLYLTDAAELGEEPRVVVQVATGQPCG
jgi:hypothetical protein